MAFLLLLPIPIPHIVKYLHNKIATVYPRGRFASPSGPLSITLTEKYESWLNLRHIQLWAIVIGLECESKPAVLNA